MLRWDIAIRGCKARSLLGRGRHRSRPPSRLPGSVYFVAYCRRWVHSARLGFHGELPSQVELPSSPCGCGYLQVAQMSPDQNRTGRNHSARRGGRGPRGEGRGEGGGAQACPSPSAKYRQVTLCR
ncbi:hypothetical protein NDU88_000098 [Pleurodeles waltl]|uniref:Uncharacterized protein n=1 Tax=Pleurodeles waltl TaxID=8319 RepID=A0AAV7P2Z4_PLEWA|nr:hypothetical protein NDU88_000098 [Pleurodeles waltl]